MLVVVSICLQLETRNNKIEYLETQLANRLQQQQKLNSNLDELKKSESLTQQQKAELQQQNDAKQQQIDELNTQLQAKIKARDASLLARVQNTITPKASAASFSYQGGPLSAEQLNFLGNCESGMNPTTNTGNGFYGAYQFTIQTWNNMGTGYDRADHAPLDVQSQAVQKLLSGSSIWSQFPGCAQKMRDAGMI